MTMENWQHNEGAKLPLDSTQGRLFEADLNKVDELWKIIGNHLIKRIQKVSG